MSTTVLVEATSAILSKTFLSSRLCPTMSPNLPEVVTSFCDSSVEFMGEFRFRELAKCVIEREFGDAKSSEAIGFSHGDFGFVVQTLDHAAGELLFSLEVIEN